MVQASVNVSCFKHAQLPPRPVPGVPSECYESLLVFPDTTVPLT